MSDGKILFTLDETESGRVVARGGAGEVLGVAKDVEELREELDTAIRLQRGRSFRIVFVPFGRKRERR